MSIPHSIKLAWHPYKIYLPEVEKWLRSNAGLAYTGNSADANSLTLWFSSPPTDQVRLGVEQYWGALTEAEEAAKIAHNAMLDRAAAYAKQNLPFLDFTQFSVAEKKIFMGQELTLQDKENLAVKYPGV